MSQKIEQLPGWDGRIDRYAAEQLLQNKPVGSYLLRNGDDVTEAVVSELEDSNHLNIKPYLCTILESEERITDLLILESSKGWTVYRDNPDLSDPEYIYYPSVLNLLAQLRKLARFPVS